MHVTRGTRRYLQRPLPTEGAPDGQGRPGGVRRKFPSVALTFEESVPFAPLAAQTCAAGPRAVSIPIELSSEVPIEFSSLR